MKIRILIIYILLFSFSSIWSQKVQIVPYPQVVKLGNGNFTIDKEVKIAYIIESQRTAHLLQQRIQQELGYQLALIEDSRPEKNHIQFKLEASLEKEAYRLIVASEGVQIIASNNTGWYYGVQSLIQLFSIHTNEDGKASIKVPVLEINDAPRFEWRAFMLDEARYFKGMEQVKLLLDEMAALKMNVFHWHLVDDQGWRIEIKKYPLLTEIGSKRISSQIGPLQWKSPIQSAEVHEGYYTQEQIKDIVSYANDRHITIVPEIEMPGHSSAAIASYSWLGTTKKEIDVPIIFGVGPDVYDISDPKVHEFLTDILDEVMELFPSKVIHIGGDEVKYTHWKASEAVRAYMKEQNLNSPAELQVFFTNGISHYLKSKGRRMMGWNEIMGHNLHEYQDEVDTKSEQQLSEGTIVHFWKGDVTLAIEAASKGYEIVNSLHSNTYLDYSYQSIPLSLAYGFEPIPKGLESKYHDMVIGLGCQMWGEWIPTSGNMHFQVFPRIAAFAEVGWTNKENKHFENFKLSVDKLKEGWTRKGIYYAPDTVVEKKELN